MKARMITTENILSLLSEQGINLSSAEADELYSFFCDFTEDVCALFCKDSWGVHAGDSPSILSFAIYADAAELGADHSGNGCREENDTDESFGEFLIGAHKNGIECGKSALHEFRSGRILTAC